MGFDGFWLNYSVVGKILVVLCLIIRDSGRFIGENFFWNFKFCYVWVKISKMWGIGIRFFRMGFGDGVGLIKFFMCFFVVCMVIIVFYSFKSGSDFC